MRFSILTMLFCAWPAIAQTTQPADTVDLERYRLAVGRLAAKGPVYPDQLNRLRAENAELKERISNLETELKELLFGFASQSPPPAGPANQSMPPGASSLTTTRSATTQRREEVVIFVVDTSGSMMGHFPKPLEETHLRVQGLPAKTSFNVVCADELQHWFRKSPVPVGQQALDDLRAFLSAQSPNGSADLLTALKAALAQRPTEIWLLSDGDVPDADKFVAEVRRINSSKTPINTVLHYVHEESHKTLLARVAFGSGGTCIRATDTLGPTSKHEPRTPKD